MKKISIIIIVYKVEAYLRQCLDSVLAQSYRELEIILVVGRSPKGDDDGCQDICREYAGKDPRIELIFCTAAGVSDARNRGLEAATGELIGFVDSDDYIDDDMFFRLASLMVKHKADIAICGRYHEFVGATVTEDTVATGEYVMDATEALGRVLRQEGFYLHCWDKLYDARLWRTVRFPVDRYVEDRVVVDRIIGSAERIVFDPKPGYHYRERINSMSKTGDVAYNNTLANETMAAYIRENFPRLSGELDRYMVYEYITALQNVYMAGNEAADVGDPWREKLGSYDPEALKKLPFSLRLKRFLALKCPYLLLWNTRRKNNKKKTLEKRFE